MDFGKLTVLKLAQWKEGCLQDLKERWKVARKGLASGFARFVLWDQEMSRHIDAMSQDQVAVGTVI